MRGSPAMLYGKKTFSLELSKYSNQPAAVRGSPLGGHEHEDSDLEQDRCGRHHWAATQMWFSSRCARQWLHPPPAASDDVVTAQYTAHVSTGQPCQNGIPAISISSAESDF